MTAGPLVPKANGVVCPADLNPLRAALSSALVALDFDGTLTPISPRPDDTRPSAGTTQLLRDLRATGATLAVVTGRSVASLLRVSDFGTVPGIIIYGLHGVERWEAGQFRAPSPPPGLQELRLSLPELLAGIVHDPAIWIEDKELSLVVHARLSAEPDRALDALREPVAKAAAAVGLDVRPGKGVLEICIPGIDKGSVMRELLTSETAAALYAGDDVADVPAVREMNAWSDRSARPKLAVAVTPSGTGPPPVLAGLTDITVPDPPGLAALLRQLIGNPPG